MATLLLIWLCVCIALMMLGNGTRYPSAGLPLAYFLSLSLIHTPGALLYLNFQQWQSIAAWTQVGFEQTVIGMVAFLVGVVIVRNFTGSASTGGQSPANLNLTELNRLAVLYFSIGLFCFVFMRFLSRIPSLGAIAAALGSLMIVGACLRLWVARSGGDGFKYWQTIAVLPLLPLLTLVKDGFLGFGTYWLLAIACFVFKQAKRPRIGYYLLAPVVAFLALSVFVTYMASRTEFRNLVWYHGAGVTTRIERVVQMFENFKWLDFSNPDHRAAIDGRLNQNMLVGLAVERLESGKVSYANGATIGQMIISLIPRALWPGKPQVGGGGTVVSDYTGIQFAEGTSVGAGNVLEFYVNFGMWGVIVGFFLYGCIIGTLDIKVIECLNSGDQNGFLLWFLICLALLQPGGNLLEIVVTVASSVVAAKGLGYILSQRLALATNGRVGIR